MTGHDARSSRQRRKPTAVRRREIADVAAELFAERGFGVPTRAIGDALGITQAALYRHFRSKDELIEEVFRLRFLEERPSDFARLLRDGDAPLAERLRDAYVDFFAGITATSLRLFLRASQDGLEIARRYSPHLEQRILVPVLEELRREATLPGLDARPMSSEERELVLMLHSVVVFLAIRKFVYRVDFDGGEPRLIERHVRVWLSGALEAIGGG